MLEKPMRPRGAICFAALVCWFGMAGIDTVPSAAQAQGPSRTLLAVFAHPDDEQVVSPMLARYAREGVRVRLIIATDGRKGVREHAGIPAGDKLAAARADEARCACEKLRIEPPTLVGLEDGALHTQENKRAFMDRLTQLIGEVRPDVIVTWGPDGVTGHTDHRMVSNLVTEVFQRGTSGGARQLFYAGLSAERMAALQQQGAPAGTGVPQGVAMVEGRYLPVRIAYTEADARAAADSLACHKTQYTPEETGAMLKMARAFENGAVRLRPWFVETGEVSDLFK
jgi:LmbE family N-acetylglucosaminyl deacetylase